MLHRQAYGIGFKWEPHGMRVVWGDSSLAPNPTLGIGMYLKEVALSVADAEWGR